MIGFMECPNCHTQFHAKEAEHLIETLNAGGLCSCGFKFTVVPILVCNQESDMLCSSCRFRFLCYTHFGEK